MTDQERYEKLENDKKKIDAAQKKLKEKMRIAEYKRYYDACMALGLTLGDLKRYAEVNAFMDCCSMLTVKTDDGDVTTALLYVTRSKEYQEMLRELEEKSAMADGAPGRAQ